MTTICRTVMLGAIVVMVTVLTGCPELKPTPTPELPSPPASPPPVIPSSVRLPIRVNAPDLKEAENQVCEYYSGEEQYDGVFYVANAKYEIWRKPLTLKLENDVFSAKMFAYYWVDAEVFVPIPPFKLHGQCGWDDEEARQVIASTESKLGWARRWFLESKTTVLPFENPNRCLLTYRNFDVTDRLNGAGERLLKKAADKFDEKIKEKSNFERYAQEAWAELQKPIDIGNGGWLQIQPQIVSAGPITATTGQPQYVDTVIGLTAEPKISFGEQPMPGNKPLPDLEALPSGPNGFHVSTDIEISFDEATRILKDPQTGLVGKTFVSGRKELRINDVRLYGTGSKIALELSVTGRAINGHYPKVVDLVTLFRKGYGVTRDFFAKKFFKLKGTIYLTGTPEYNKDDRIVFFPDAEYDVDTKNVIVKLASWILKSQLTERLRQEAKLPLGPKLDSLKDNLGRSLNRPLGANAQLTGSVDSLKLDIIFVDGKSVKGRVSTDGSAQLTVNWQP